MLLNIAAFSREYTVGFEAQLKTPWKSEFPDIEWLKFTFAAVI